MKLKFFLITLLTLLFKVNFVFCQPSTGVNLLDCQPTGQSGDLVKCTLITGEIIAEQAWDFRFSVRYDFDCSPGNVDKLQMGIATERQEARFNYGMSGTIAVEGTGPLSVVDFDQNGNSIKRHKKGCSLVINTIDLSPSDTTVSFWKAKVSELNVLLAEFERAGDVTSDLLKYFTAFAVIHSVSKNFYAEITSETTKDIRENCIKYIDLLYDLSLSAVFAGDPQIGDKTNLVSKLASILGTFGNATAWKKPDGSWKSFADWFDPQKDKPLLDLLAESGSPDKKKKYEEDLIHFQQKVIETTEDIADYQALLEKYNIK